MDAGACDSTTTEGAIDVLLGEHRTILGVLDEVERESRRLESGTPLRESFWRNLLHFSDEFDSNLHHHKEELLLFPALERAGLSATSGPTAVLRDEHARSQFWRTRIEQALVARDRARLTAASNSYLDLVRAHVLKENQILFPLARRLLPTAQLDQLHREFRLYAADQRVHYWLKQPYAPVTESTEAAPDGSSPVRKA